MKLIEAYDGMFVNMDLVKAVKLNPTWGEGGNKFILQFMFCLLDGKNNEEWVGGKEFDTKEEAMDWLKKGMYNGDNLFSN